MTFSNYSSPGSGFESRSLTPSFNKLRLSTYYVCGTRPSTGYPKLKKAQKGSPLRMSVQQGSQNRIECNRLCVCVCVCVHACTHRCGPTTATEAFTLQQAFTLSHDSNAPDVFINCLRKHSRGSVRRHLGSQSEHFLSVFCVRHSPPIIAVNLPQKSCQVSILHAHSIAKKWREAQEGELICLWA